MPMSYHREDAFRLAEVLRPAGDFRRMLLLTDQDDGTNGDGFLLRAQSNFSGTMTEVGTIGRDGKLHFVGAQLTGLSTGIAHVDSSGNISSSCVSLTADVCGVLPSANGGFSWVAAPITHASPGTAGQLAYDGAGNFYVCFGLNQWAKFAPTSTTF